MKRLHRSNDNLIGGICSGISEYFDIDPSFVRILFTILLFTPYPIGITYLFMWMIIPIK